MMTKDRQRAVVVLASSLVVPCHTRWTHGTAAVTAHTDAALSL